MNTTSKISRDSIALVRRLWQYCNVLRDDGLSYPDYVEQLTYLLFLKMSDEQKGGPVPEKIGWRSLVNLDADAMHQQYTRILASLGNERGMLGLIFGNARNKIRDPVKLRLLVVGLIGQTQWTGLDGDLKGHAYEGLLEKNARDIKSGAGQYFTPRPLIDAIVECVNPKLGEVICDPACGTAGFLLVANDYIRRQNPNMTDKQSTELATKSFRGIELVEEVARLATMNLLLHGIGGNGGDEFPIERRDSLKESPRTQIDVVMTNPPFGIRGSIPDRLYPNSSGGNVTPTTKRKDFWVQTANKQLNFLQHIVAMLKPAGRAAVVIPDNVLFEAGAAATIRRHILETCRVRAILRLPSGLFYAQGIKSNVLFFDRFHEKMSLSPVSHFWVYDLRSDKHFSLKTKPLQRADLNEFVSLYRSDFRFKADESTRQPSRFRRFDVQQILATRDCRLDLTWTSVPARSRTPGLARLDEISQLVADDLQRALEIIKKVRN